MKTEYEIQADNRTQWLLDKAERSPGRLAKHFRSLFPTCVAYIKELNSIVFFAERVSTWSAGETESKFIAAARALLSSIPLAGFDTYERSEIERYVLDEAAEATKTYITINRVHLSTKGLMLTKSALDTLQALGAVKGSGIDIFERVEIEALRGTAKITQAESTLCDIVETILVAAMPKQRKRS